MRNLIIKERHLAVRKICLFVLFFLIVSPRETKVTPVFRSLNLASSNLSRETIRLSAELIRTGEICEVGLKRTHHRIWILPIHIVWGSNSCSPQNKIYFVDISECIEFFLLFVCTGESSLQ